MALAKSGIGFILGDNQQATDKICAVAINTGVEVRWVKIHNSIKHIKQIRQACPNTKIIGRLTAPEGVFNSFIHTLESGGYISPQDAATQYYGLMKAIIGDAPNSKVWWEVCPPGFASWALSNWLNDYFIAIMKLLEADGRRGVICNWYTGTPRTRSDGVDGWTPFMPAINWAAGHGHIIGAQAYWELPDVAMQDTGNWTAYRPLRVFQDYQFPSGTVWVPSEFGFDGPGGYRDHNISGDAYYDALVRADNKFRTATYPINVKVDGFTIFVLQAWGTGWEGFLFWEIFDRLLNYIISQGVETGTQPPPPPPPSDEIWIVKVVSTVNQRSGPSANHTWLGAIGVSTPPTILKVHSNLVNGYHEVVGQGWWVYSDSGRNLVRIG